MIPTKESRKKISTTPSKCRMPFRGVEKCVVKKAKQREKCNE